MSKSLAERFPEYKAVFESFESGEYQVNALDSKGNSFLHEICRHEDVNIVKAYIEELQGEVHQHNEDGLAGIHIAIRYGNIDTFKYLLAIINDPVYSHNAYQAPLLHFAVQADTASIEILQTLLDKGADLNAQDKHGWPALPFAMERGDMNTLEFLLKSGAKAGHVNPNELTALEMAEKQNASELIALLKRYL